ncbi:hypothetical protein BHE90_011043 [Fusarium euwallaceae]|uniref:Uncharacterized protein n=2 Tax=Fusarium solani species complex TaxID=232080 RepID=A0A430LFL9_9HYPO|nr:hypothetical protein CEP51_007972 [Fusarium floridanum]RTE74509.1 hypothetical protein BHE90_011043 [Fusarium euwallaceae]
MKSWDGLNYYTTNTTLWVELMNRSTEEWGIGYLPAKLVAIPGKFNSSYNISDDAILIQHAAESKAGSRDTEKIIFGVASGIVILFMAAWIFINFDDLKPPTDDDEGTGVKPVEDAISARTRTTEQTANEREDAQEFAAFCQQLKDFYYNDKKSELEAAERDIVEESGPTVEKPWVGDIEEASALLRKLYSLKITMRNDGDSEHVTLAERNRHLAESDAILAEVNRIIEARATAMRDPSQLRAEEEDLAQIREIETAVGEIEAENHAPMRWDDSQRSRVSRVSR